jgi:hypothetical protein
MLWTVVTGQLLLDKIDLGHALSGLGKCRVVEAKKQA